MLKRDRLSYGTPRRDETWEDNRASGMELSPPKQVSAQRVKDDRLAEIDEV